MSDSAHLPILHSDALPSGTRLGEFELVRLLGVGGFGMVYEAYDHSLHRSVAIKEYMPTALAGRAGGVTVGIRSSLDGASYQAGLQSFVAEARLLAQFDHPSLVKVLRFWEANNTAYMVMPLYSGMTLKQARGQMRSPPSEDWLRQVLWSVLQALKLLHDSHTVHRDVSPENIFLQDSGPPVLLDLGAARRAIGDLGPRHTAVLKVNYAPIEQYADARDMVQGPWSDLYALAAVVHGCVANTLPLPATFRVLRDRMPSMQMVALAAQAEHGQAYSPAFVAAIDQSLAIRPEDRPQTVQAFAHAMDLHPSAEMAQFDWRAEMGLGWKPAPREWALPVPIDLAELPTQFVYPPRPSVDRPLELLGPLTAPQGAPGPRRARVWVVVAALALVAGVGTAVWRRPADLPRSVAVMPTPEPKLAMLAPTLPAVPSVAVAEPMPPLVAAPVQAASSPLVPPRKTTATAKVKVMPPASVPADEVVSAHLAQRHRASPGGNTAVFLCTDNNFLTRPMCLYRECQKPEFAALPVCIENAQSLQAPQQNRR
ncbi:serine/threonine protein kinase [Rhodoferax sp. WC2427]|uniref:serine/threonine protein kinase n=1 Tax=Rhodoferax sp. WC2427 TaxID=3234144 RepID=UPI0034672383